MTAKGARDAAILAALYGGGVRRSAVSQLDLVQFDDELHCCWPRIPVWRPGPEFVSAQTDPFLCLDVLLSSWRADLLAVRPGQPCDQAAIWPIPWGFNWERFRDHRPSGIRGHRHWS